MASYTQAFGFAGHKLSVGELDLCTKTGGDAHFSDGGECSAVGDVVC